jgi:hypothetical protein
MITALAARWLFTAVFAAATWLQAALFGCARSGSV